MRKNLNEYLKIMLFKISDTQFRKIIKNLQQSQ